MCKKKCTFAPSFRVKVCFFMQILSKGQEKIWDLNPIWNLLTTGEKNYIEAESQFVSYHKNDLLHAEGEVPAYMMMLIKGKVRIYKEGIGPKPQIIRMLKPFDLFGYRAIVAGDYHSSCASAVEDSVVCRVPSDAFLRVLQQNNAFCFRVFEDMAQYLAISELRSVNLTQKHIRGRLAESLMTLKQNYGLDEDEATIAMYISREDLANLSSMTTANAIRTLSQFAQEGIISIDGRKIKILQEDELVKISQMG